MSNSLNFSNEKPLKIVHMGGGLCNQILKYIFARCVEELTGSDVIFDDTFIRLNPEIHDYDLGYMFPNLKKHELLSQYISSETIEAIIQKNNLKNHHSLPGYIAQHLFANVAGDLCLCAEPCVTHDDGIRKFAGKMFLFPYDFNSNYARVPGNVYFWGNWTYKGWFDIYRQMFLKELTFRPVTDEKNKNYERLIKENNSVGIHIRRGDFPMHGMAQSTDYYKKHITSIKNPNPMFIVFSDDIPWCKENEEKLGLSKVSKTYVEGNFGIDNAYIDLYLMSICDYIIRTPGSTFSAIAVMLNQNVGFDWNKDEIDWLMFAREDAANGPNGKVKTIYEIFDNYQHMSWKINQMESWVRKYEYSYADRIRRSKNPFIYYVLKPLRFGVRVTRKLRKSIKHN